MTLYALPYYENEVCARLAFIEPRCTTWSAVSIGHLKELRGYLLTTWFSFRGAVQNDISMGCSAHSSVTSIYRSLKKYTRWFSVCMPHVISELESVEGTIREKAKLALDIIHIIEVVWIPFLFQYRPLQEKLNQQKDLLSASEKRQYRLADKAEEQRAIDIRALLGSITGDHQEERERKFEILRDTLDGLGGKDAAKYLEAARRLKWIVEKPPFALMQKYWGIKGGSAAVSKYKSVVLEDEIIENAMVELFSKLKS